MRRSLAAGFLFVLLAGSAAAADTPITLHAGKLLDAALHRVVLVMKGGRVVKNEVRTGEL